MAEQPTTPNAVYNSQPTVRVNTQAYPKITELIKAMQMIETEGGMSALELRLTNNASDTSSRADFAFEDGLILKLGAAIAVYGGDATSPQQIFNGKITALEAEFTDSDVPPHLIVLAEDVFQQARMARRTRVHSDVTLANLLSDLAKTISLTPVIAGFTDNIGTQVQFNESDLAFVRRLLTRYDGDIQVVGTELHASPRSEVRRNALELKWQSQLRRARVTADLAHQTTKVTATGWDPAGGQRVRADASGANLGPGSGTTGADALRDALGERSENLGTIAVTTTSEAKAVADAAFDHRARRFVCIDATAEGNPALRVGTQVTLTGLGPRFSNTYYVVRACHRFDHVSGYETDFRAECAYLGHG